MSKKRKSRAPIAPAERPKCPYCGGMSMLVTGAQVYPRRPDLADKPLYKCTPCDAWVGCHPGTLVPLGRMANKALRQAKMRAHAAFDPLWKAKMLRDDCKQGEARRAGYRWLSEQLGIAFDDCHIGMFDVEQCDRVELICTKFRSGMALGETQGTEA